MELKPCLRGLYQQYYANKSFRDMLIYCVLQIISAQWQKCGFAIAYKSSAYMPDLAAHPWTARKRRINQSFLS